MEALLLTGTEDTPKITLDCANNVYEISGRSLPEDVTVFYKPVFDWLQNYSEHPSKSSMNLSFKLEYFNTASSKVILDILMKLEEIREAGVDVSIKWHYDQNDEDMQEAGEEYADLVSLPFELMAY